MRHGTAASATAAGRPELASQCPPDNADVFLGLSHRGAVDVPVWGFVYQGFVCFPGFGLEGEGGEGWLVYVAQLTLNSILVFILTLLLLSADFYYLKNIAGRRLVGLRWWNEVNVTTGDSHWVFESSDPTTRTVAATDKRFFWLSLYVAPAFWVGLAILAIIKLSSVIWLSLVGEWAGYPCFSGSLCKLTHYSYRPDSHNHEYGGILAV